MAKAKLTLLLDLADKLTGKLNKVSGRVAKFQDKNDKRFDRFAKRIGTTSDKLNKSMRVASFAIIGMLGVIGHKSVKAAAEFDSAFLNIKQLNLDKSKGELESYRSEIREATFDMGTNLKDSTDAMYDLQSATGLYGKDAISIFKKVAKYSVATGANINDAMNSTTKAMKAFGLGVNDIDHLLTSNAKTVQTGITTFDELAKVQTEYAGASASAGQGIDQANKVFAMFTSIAKNSDVGANMTKTFFQGLGQQADKFEETLGVQVFDKNGSMRDADLILKDISSKFKGMTDKEITQAINKIGGPEGLRGALDKVKVGTEDMIRTFNDFDSSTFNLDDALVNAEGDFGKMKELLSNRFEVLMSKIGEVLIPILVRLFEYIMNGLTWLNDNSDFVIPLFIGLGSAIGIATVASWGLNASLLANPIVLIISAIIGLIVWLVRMANKLEGWGKLWDAIVFNMKSNWNVVTSYLKLKWLEFKDVFLMGIDGIQYAWYNLKSLWDEEGAAAGLQKLRDKSKARMDEIAKQKNAVKGYTMDLLKSYQDMSTALTWKEDEDNEKIKNDLLGDGGLIPDGKDGKDGKNAKGSVTNSVNKITGASTNAKNIKINIDALHKGDNNLTGDNGKRLSMREYEAMFEEMIQRILRNAEMSL